MSVRAFDALTIISIHAPRVGSDKNMCWSFLRREISIHAPRVGSDLHLAVIMGNLADFNPRSPCGERRS